MIAHRFFGIIINDEKVIVIKLNYIKLQNFMSFKKCQTVNLEDLGLTLLNGINSDAGTLESNGSGKSNLIESIIYSLYGKLSDGTTGDSIINDSSKKNLYTELGFEVAGHKYVVKRYRKDSKFKNKTLLFRDGEEITKSSVKLTNEAIESIIGIDLSTYLHSIFFGLGDVVPFTRATDKQKKEILEDAANISIYKEAQDVSKQHQKNVQEEIDAENKSNQLLNSHLGYLKAQNEKQTDNLKSLKESIDKVKNGLNQSKKLIDNYQFDQEVYDKYVSAKSLLLDSLNSLKLKDTAKIQSQLNDQSQQYYQLKNKCDNYQSNYQNFCNSIVKLIKSTDNKCEYCGSVLDEEHKKIEISNLREKVISLKPMISATKGSLSILKNDLDKYKKELSEINAQNEAISKKGNGLREKLKVVMSQLDDMDKYKSQYELAKSDIKHLASSLDQYQKSYESAKEVEGNEEIEKVTKQIKDSDSKLKKLSDKLLAYKDVVSIYSDKGVKAHVLGMLLPYLNDQANHYLGYLSDGTISINIAPFTTAESGNTSGKINIEVNNLSGSSEYKRNSKGERQRIDLAISLSLQDYVLSQTGTKTNLIAYDEVFDGLDNAGINQLINLLKERVKIVPTIIIVSHNDALKSMVENTIVVHKKNGESKIEY